MAGAWTFLFNFVVFCDVGHLNAMPYSVVQFATNGSRWLIAADCVPDHQGRLRLTNSVVEQSRAHRLLELAAGFA
jgi:hypothetical protein